jgi:S-DNA-T family DNA segregation ATPase FtsK/SpoIIIE
MIARADNGQIRGRFVRGVSNQISFLPEPLRNFIRRRCIETLGLLLISSGIAFAISLVDYNSLDPSINSAGDQPIKNILGVYGAAISDLALQYFGLSSVLPPLIALTWGIKLLRHQPIRHSGWRLLALLISILMTSYSLNYLTTPNFWPLHLHSGLGGVFGYLTYNLTSSIIAINDIPPYFIGIGTGIVALLSLLSSLALNWSDWQKFPNILRLTITILQYVFLWTVRKPLMLARGSSISFIPTSKKTMKTRHQPQPIRAPRVTGSSTQKEPAITSASKTTRVTPRSKTLKLSQQALTDRQAKLELLAPGESYELPSLDLLTETNLTTKTSNQVSEEALEQNARVLETVLEDFGVYGEIVQVRPGPVVTLYELEPAPGTKTNRVIGLADDIARSMSAVSVRIAVVPGQNVIGIELPNASREHVNLRELLASSSFEKKSGGLTLALGKNIGGEPMMVDLARMPHLLIAGTTGSGKSVGINAMIASLLYRVQPEECRFIMIDPKMLELSVYDGIPHLLAPVVTEPKKAVVALKWVTREMENRYRSMSKLGVRNIAGYNQRIDQARKKGEVLSRRVQTGFDIDSGRPVFEEQPFDMAPLPFIVVIVDEMADLMLVAGKEVEAAVQRLAQMARAAGIHLILATQRPSVDVITGTIKANLPTRISFQVTTKIDSRTILGGQGAEQLLGHGDMLYMEGGGKITRVHGPFVSDLEVESLVAFLKSQGEPDYLDDVTEDVDIANGIPGFDSSENSSSDKLYDQAVELVAREQKASTSFVQRHLQIGYNRAARIIEQMEKQGVVSSANHVGRREILIADHSSDA